MSCGLIAYAYISSGEIRPSIDAALLPTAEYLYGHPQPTLPYLQVNFREVESSICYGDGYSHEGDFRTQPRLSFSLWTETFLNGSRVPFLALQINQGSYISEPPFSYLTFCIDKTGLNTGLHLVEVRLKKGPWDTPIIYQWAVRVE